MRESAIDGFWILVLSSLSGMNSTEISYVGNAHPTEYQGFWRFINSYFSAITLRDNFPLSKLAPPSRIFCQVLAIFREADRAFCFSRCF